MKLKSILKSLFIISALVVCFGFTMPPDYPSCPVPGTYQSISVTEFNKGIWNICSGYRVKINNPSDKSVSFEIEAVGAKNISQTVLYGEVGKKDVVWLCFDATNTQDYNITRLNLRVTSCSQ